MAINCFQDELTFTEADASVKFSNIYIDSKDFEAARNVLHRAYLKFPNNIEICDKYASVATELGLNKIALFFYDKLTTDEPDNISHKGYLGNACLNLNLNDTALESYQKANDLANNTQAWILSNIGNLLKNKGFYSEGVKYFRKGIELNNTSEYALERLATSLKLKEEEQKEYRNFIKEGRKMIRDYTVVLEN